MKQCKVCEQTRNEDDFYLVKGYRLRTCKYCESEHSKRYYRKHRDRVLARMRVYNKSSQGKAREAHMREKYPEKRRARELLRYAVSLGRMVRPDKCSGCSADDVKIQGHHPDYSKPLDVIWLCITCHREAESKP